jgi:HPt (histidine-containing phosphotransfer) domain-containing protein
MGMKAMFLKSGMNDFIPKPIEATELNQVLTLWLPDNKKHQLNIESKLSVSAKTTIDSSYQSVINRKIGIKNSAGDEKLYEQLTSNFKKDHADDMKKISEHINNSDLIAARYYAHTLKSAASLIGASPLARTAEIAEKAIVNKNLTLQQLHALESEFAKVFNELAILEMPRELIEVATHAFNREKALDLVEIMIPLLASGNANVLDYAPEAMSAFAFFGEPCLLFADALNDFEFEEALRILNVIKTKIHEG